MDLPGLAKKLGVKPEIVIEAIRLSPNARGYIEGAISELVVKQELEKSGYELKRIKEKWEGEKLHFGDFYITKKGSERWYVFESKGLKSNSEKWHKLTKKETLTRFLKKYNEEMNLFETEEALTSWVERNHADNLDVLKKNIRVLETHLVSGVSGRKGKKKRTIHTPRKDEFDYVSFDLFLRTENREFIFADPDDLGTSKKHKTHLRQNYIIDILLKDVRSEPKIRLPWHKTLDEIWDDTKDPVVTSQMQEDTRASEPEALIQ